jgi:hypothetical protein
MWLLSMLKREGDKVWLDLDEFYPPPDMHPNTVFKSMAIAFQAMGSQTSYVDLMGLSAAAFRLQVGANMCPSSPHPHLGYPCDSLAQQALGYEYREYEWDPNHTEKATRAREAVVANIDAGIPLLAEAEETGLVVGYVDDGQDILLRPPYSRTGEEPEGLGDWPGWAFTLMIKLPSQPTREGMIESLAVGVGLAHAKEPIGSGYFSGFGAYERWISDLQDGSFLARATCRAGAILVGNAHIYYCLVDARRSAAEYLRGVQGQFREDVRSHLERAAAHYDSVADTLDNGWANVPWPRQVTSVSEWTQEQRSNQASLLRQVVVLERQAVGELERALETLETSA